MPCNCGSTRKSPQNFVHTAPDGTRTTYKTQIEAEMAKARKGGTVSAK